MSLITKDNRLTVKRFAAVPDLPNLPSIQRTPGSVSQVSSFEGVAIDGGIDLSEGCLVTKSVKYTHQLVHWVNGVRSGDPDEVEDLIDRLCITPYLGFRINHRCNLAFLEPFVRTSLDLYAFVAVTASSSTLDGLITMVRIDNDRRQFQADNLGASSPRSFNFTVSSFVNPEYELVALHPEHFLPYGSMLAVYDPTAATYKNYFAAKDQCLRESPEPNSPRLPPFHHKYEGRGNGMHLNVFLVVLNAGIKFRRYFEMVKLNPPATPLPDDVLNLMRHTIELVDMIYWNPVPTKDSYGEKVAASLMADSWRFRGRVTWPDPEGNFERDSSEGSEKIESEDNPNQASWSNRDRVKWVRWFENADLETRKAYGSAILSGHDYDYDPVLFEDAFPINYEYSKKADVEAWAQDVTPDIE